MVNLTSIVLSDIRQLNIPRRNTEKSTLILRYKYMCLWSRSSKGFLSCHYFRKRKRKEKKNCRKRDERAVKKERWREMIMNREWRHENTAGEGDWGTTTFKLLGHMKTWKTNGRAENKRRNFEDLVEGLCVVWGHHRARVSGLMATRNTWNRVPVWCIILGMTGMPLIHLLIW